MNRQFLLVVLTFLTIAAAWPYPSHSQIISVSGENISRSKIEKVILDRMDSLKIPGVSIAIIGNGKIVYEKSFGLANIESGKLVTANTIFEAASLSKPVFGYFLMKLVQDGIIKLDFDKPVYEYFPYPDIAYDDRYKLITPRMLLTHTSGFPNWRKNDKLTIEFTPGTQYSYSGEGYEYMAAAAASLAHTDPKGLDSVFQKVVCTPLGLLHFGYIKNDYFLKYKAYGYYTDSSEENGKPKPIPEIFGAAYSLHTNAHAYAKFLIAIMKNKGLKKAYIDTLLYPHVRKSPDDSLNKRYYGYGFTIDSTKYGVRYQHTGSNGNFTCGFMFFRMPKVGFVLFTNGDKGSALVQKLTEILTDGEY